MPGMDGFDTCTRLKANASVAQVPVVFMTGLTETEHVVAGARSRRRRLPDPAYQYRRAARPHAGPSLQCALRPERPASHWTRGAASAGGARRWNGPLVDRRRPVSSDRGHRQRRRSRLRRRAHCEWMRGGQTSPGERQGTFTLQRASQTGAADLYLGAVGANEYLFG